MPWEHLPREAREHRCVRAVISTETKWVFPASLVTSPRGPQCRKSCGSEETVCVQVSLLLQLLHDLDLQETRINRKCHRFRKYRPFLAVFKTILQSVDPETDSILFICELNYSKEAEAPAAADDGLTGRASVSRSSWSFLTREEPNDHKNKR